MSALSVDDIVRIATASAQAAARELAAAPSTFNAAAAAAAASATASHNTIKKVELPTFDKANIHTWIRRVEAAFGRAGVTLSKDKFFFIESKIDVNLNPKINEYLCGESTDAKWDEFLEYLQEEYGRSKEQQAALFLRGIPREGLRPTQHLAKIRDLTKDIKLDDLIKEMVLKDLPPSIRQSLAERTDASAEDAAKAADHYFDRDGNPKHKTASSTVNHVLDHPDNTETEDEADINAVSRNRFRGARPGQNNNNQPRPPAKPQHDRSRNWQANRNQARQQTDGHRNANWNNTRTQASQQTRQPTLQRVCKYHLDFGDKAVNCEAGCQYEKRGSAPSGNGAAGRRR